MSQIRLLTFAVVGLLLLNLCTIGFLLLRGRPSHPVGGHPAGGHPAGGPPAGGDPASVIISRLHFDEQQQTRYRQLVEQHQQQSRELAWQERDLFQRYYGLLTESAPDTARATALSQQIADNQRATAQLNFAHFAQIKALCRPNQQANFRKLVGDLTQLFGAKPGAGRPGPGGPPPPQRPQY